MRYKISRTDEVPEIFLFSSKNMWFFDEARSIFVDVHAADENVFD